MDLLEYLVRVQGAEAAAAKVALVKDEFKGLAKAQLESGAAGAEAGAGLGKAEGAAGALGGKGMGLAKMGALAAGAALVAVGAKSVQMSNQFQTEMLKIRTEGGATSKEFRHMSKAVVDMSTSGQSMGQGPVALAQGLYHLESMGLRGSRALQALKLSSQEAAISGSKLEDTTTAVGSTMVVGMKGTGSLAHAMGTLNAIAGAGNMRFQDLNEALGTGLLSSAKTAGLSLQETGAALAVLTDAGMPASSAAAQLATSLHYLYAPGAKAQAALQTVGLSGNKLAADLHKPQGLLTAFKDLRAHMTGMGKIQQADFLNSLFPGGRGRVLLSLFNMQNRLGPKYKQTNAGDAIDFQHHVAEQAHNPATKLATATAKLQGNMVKLGNAIGKYVNPALQALTNIGADVVGVMARMAPTLGKLAVGGARVLAVAFRAIATAINVTMAIARQVNAVFLAVGKAIVSVAKGAIRIGTSAWNTLKTAIGDVASTLSSVIDAAGKAGSAIASVGKAVNNAGGGLPAKILGAVIPGLDRPGGPAGHWAGEPNSPHWGGAAGHHTASGRAHAPGPTIHHHTGDIVVKVGAKEMARVTRRQIIDSMMASA